MIAPRKKLWSTPDEVITRAIELLNIHTNDIIYDIGCGDGRFLIKCMDNTSKCAVRYTGIEIDDERANKTIKLLNELNYHDKCNIICGNALEQDYSSATCIFLYLTERGLRLIYPLIIDAHKKNAHQKLIIVTYMSMIPNCDIKPISSEKVKTTVHPIGEWPLHCYCIEPVAEVGQDNLNNNYTTTTPTVTTTSTTTATNIGDTVFNTNISETETETIHDTEVNSSTDI